MSDLVNLITNWERFKLLHPDGNQYMFAKWLLQQNETEELNAFDANDAAFDKFTGHQKTSMQASYLLSKLNQYINYYTKPIMKKNGLHSLDDYGYMQNILFFPGITKSKVCEQMLHEITTGVDIIKRLINQGLVKEKISKEDKRAKTLEITPKGEKMLKSMEPDFLNLPDTLGTMPTNARNQLIKWLMELDHFHADQTKKIQK